MTNPTQVTYPWRAAVRSGAQTFAGVIGALVVALPLVKDFVDAVAPGSPVSGWIVTAAGIAGALSVLITRLMALEQVNDLLTRAGLGATPKGE